MVSIIMPAYNAEKTINKSINSIVNQIYKDFELIIINDGSEDGTQDIIDSWVKKDSRIKSYVIKNSGPANARSVGLNAANGKYIAFCDADDEMHEDMLQQMESKFDEDIDLVACCYDGKNENQKSNIKDILNRNEVIKLSLDCPAFGGYLWNKLFKREIIEKNHIRFNNDISFCEDLLFIIQYVVNINKAIYIDECLYKYCENVTSLTSQKFSWNKISNIKARMIIAEILDEIGDSENKKIADRLLLEQTVFAYRQIKEKFKLDQKLLGEDRFYDSQYKKLIKKICSSYNWIYILSLNIRPKVKFDIYKLSVSNVKMMKIGIVTIIDRNLGNRLQNYALQKYLEEMGYDVKTIVYRKRSFKNDLKRIIKNMLYPFVDRYKDVVWGNFNKNIKWDNRLVNEYPKEINNDYDYFIVGSDQVWNPNFDFISSREFLTFADKDKRIAYAASIGVDSIPDKKRGKYAEYLRDFKSISVRENEAAKIVLDLTDRDVMVVLDPTMLFTHTMWEDIARKTRVKVNNRYILKYFLGGCCEKYNEAIEKLASDNSCEIFDIMDTDGKVKNNIGPSEFVYLIQNSQCVCTDSFHGTVFSILFHKQFYVFERPTENGYGNMNSRINTLFSLLDIEQNYISSSLEILDLKISSGINYNRVDSILELERGKAKQYLIESMKR